MGDAPPAPRRVPRTQGVLLLPLAALPLALILAAPPEGIVVDLDALRAQAETMGVTEGKLSARSLLDGGILGDVAALVLGALGSGIGAIVTDQRLGHGPRGVAAAWRRLLPRAPTLLASTLVLVAPLALLGYLGSLLVAKGQVVPGAFLTFLVAIGALVALLRFSLVVPVSVLESHGTGGTLARSRRFPGSSASGTSPRTRGPGR